MVTRKAGERVRGIDGEGEVAHSWFRLEDMQTRQNIGQCVDDLIWIYMPYKDFFKRAKATCGKNCHVLGWPYYSSSKLGHLRAKEGPICSYIGTRVNGISWANWELWPPWLYILQSISSSSWSISGLWEAFKFSSNVSLWSVEDSVILTIVLSKHCYVIYN